MTNTLKKSVGEINIKQALLILQRELCWICRDPIGILGGTHKTFGSKKMASLDHVIPHARGGASILPNLALTCVECNRAKGDLNNHEFWQILLLERPELNRHTPPLPFGPFAHHGEGFRKKLWKAVESGITVAF